MGRTLKLPNADDPVLRQLNNLRTLQDALLLLEPILHPSWLDQPVMSGEPGKLPTFEEMMAVVNRRRPHRALEGKP